MKKIYFVLSLIAAVGIMTVVLLNRSNAPSNTSSQAAVIEEKVYVALEEEGKVAVVDPVGGKIIAKIDLSESIGSETVRYMAHNIQVAPNGKVVAVTANVAKDMEMEEGSQMVHGQKFDKLILIDPFKDEILRRIPIAQDSHLAHVVFSPDSKTMFVTLQEEGGVYSVDVESRAVVSKINLGKDSGPHGLRVSPDGSELVVALLEGKGIAVANIRTNDMKKTSLSGAAVQTAITPDGRYVFASVYDTRQIAWFDRQEDTEGSINLPNESRGPVQIYPSPDSRYLYVADQGYYFNQPAGSLVYRIDLASKIVDNAIVAGSAPHGIVVSPSGARVYVTNLFSDDMSIIDVATNKELFRIPVGNAPNGISVWHRETGGTP